MRRVIEPILAGAGQQAWSDEDLAYVHDLGLVTQDVGGRPRIANPIYAEVVPRYLNYAVQAGLPQEMAWYVDAAGSLDVAGLIAAFQAFFREHSEHWVQRFEQYHEAGPQLLLQAHLQRIAGGGRIEREYALGRGRTDLLIVWPQGERERRWVVECKVRHGDLERTIEEGLVQTRAYIDRCARRRPATSSCSTGRRSGVGRRRSSAVTRHPERAHRSRCGACEPGSTGSIKVGSHEPSCRSRPSLKIRREIARGTG